MSDIKRVSVKEAISIINNREPLGKFYTIENERYVAIDNTAGDTWVEEFMTLASCKDWLNELESEGQIDETL